MKINLNTWHARVYRFWQRAIPTSSRHSWYRNSYWEDDEERERRINTTTLCHYFWVVVLRAPARWIFQGTVEVRGTDVPVPVFWIGALALVGVIYGLIVETTATLIGIGIALAVVGVICGLAYSIAWWDDTGRYKWYRWRDRREEEKEEKPRREDTFVKVISERLKAKKAKVCPIIELTEADDA